MTPDEQLREAMLGVTEAAAQGGIDMTISYDGGIGSLTFEFPGDRAVEGLTSMLPIITASVGGSFVLSARIMKVRGRCFALCSVMPVEEQPVAFSQPPAPGKN